MLKGNKDGPTIAVRADMDALPVTEDTDLPFKSTKRGTYNGQDVGIMHACGHDIHTAVQMGVASVLIDLKADIPGTVLFIFQPAEEGPPPGEEGGAELSGWTGRALIGYRAAKASTCCLRNCNCLGKHHPVDHLRAGWRRQGAGVPEVAPASGR